MTPIRLAGSASLAGSAPAAQPSSAPSGSLHDASTHPHEQDGHGPIVIVRVRALVPEKVKLSDLAQGTARATVLAIDEELNQLKVQTAEGQQLMLFFPPDALAHLRVGTPCLLQVAQRSMREASRPPEHEEALW
jgi:hypothetical protein